MVDLQPYQKIHWSIAPDKRSSICDLIVEEYVVLAILLVVAVETVGERNNMYKVNVVDHL